MSSLLIIGGSGFFGKSFLSYFERNSSNFWNVDKITILCRNPSILHKSLPLSYLRNVEFIEGDIGHLNNLPYFDYIIHAASSSKQSDYDLNPKNEYDNILHASKNFIKLAKINQQNSKILYISSGAVYGIQPKIIEKVDENYEPDSLNLIHQHKLFYTSAKRKSEKLFLKLGYDSYNVSIARCFTFLGPWLPLDQHFAIGNFLADGFSERPIKVTAKNEVIRSYLYSDDLVEWLMAIVVNSSPSCPIFNVGSDQEVSIHNLAEKIGKYFNQAVISNSIEKASIDRYVPNVDKIKRDLNVNIKFNLEKAIEETCKQIRFNKLI